MSKRLLGVLATVLLLPGLLAGPALAAEETGEGAATEAVEEGPPPEIGEIGTQSQVAQEFFPEGYEQPTVLPPILYSLLGVAAIAALVVFLLFLVWQPRFSQERNTKAKGRR